MRGHADLILVFSNLLAFKDKDQFVDKHPRCISEEVGIPEDQVRAALRELEAPDPESRSEAHEGRRLLRMDDHRDWGWFVVNGAYYDGLRNSEERRIQNLEAQARRRRKLTVIKSQQESADVSNGHHESAESAPVSGSGAGSVKECANSEGFDLFWEVYPRKKAKADALKTWKKLKLDSLAAEIVVAVAAQKRGWGDPKYIPYPASWLNDKRWEDAPDEPSSSFPTL